MASIKVKFRPSTNENKEGTIYYQIIQNRVIRQLKTDYRLFMYEWSTVIQKIVLLYLVGTYFFHIKSLKWNNIVNFVVK